MTTTFDPHAAFDTARRKRDQAQREMEQAERDQQRYRDLLREADIQAGLEHRNAETRAGGYLRHVNRAAEAFAQAVRDGDGAAVIATWITWRREAAKVSAVADAYSSWQSRERPGTLAGGYGAPQVPDLATALAAAVAPLENADRAGKAGEIQADHTKRRDAIMARLVKAEQ